MRLKWPGFALAVFAKESLLESVGRYRLSSRMRMKIDVAPE